MLALLLVTFDMAGPHGSFDEIPYREGAINNDISDISEHGLKP